MITINLIPKKLKQEIEFRKLLSFVNKGIISIVLIFVLYFAVLSAGKYILTEHYQTTKESYALINKDTESRTNDLDSIHREIDFIHEIQTDTINLSMLIYDISLSDTKGIDIATFSVNKKEKIFNIRGEAKNREDLLTFKEKLEEIPYISEIIIPLQSLFQKENISFDINASIESYELETK